MGANGGIEGANRNVEGAIGGAPDFSMIIAQQLQNLLPAMLAQVSNRGNVRNQNGNVANENIHENVRNVLVNGNRIGCSYKDFLDCNPKEYDGKGGVVVLTRWIEKMESVHDMSVCSIDQKVKYTAGLFVGKALTWWNSQIGTLSREVAKVEKRENVRETSKDKNSRDDNKRTRNGNVFATTVNPIGRENMGMDWLSNYKAGIICHEKVVRIPLSDGNVLRVLGERPEEKARFLMGVKKQE
ncbi:hypothetical protein Tco_1444675 [Tanacetum coccineum]